MLWDEDHLHFPQYAFHSLWADSSREKVIRLLNVLLALAKSAGCQAFGGNRYTADYMYSDRGEWIFHPLNLHAELSVTKVPQLTRTTHLSMTCEALWTFL